MVARVAAGRRATAGAAAPWVVALVTAFGLLQGRGGLLEQPHAARHAVASGGEPAAARVPGAGRRSGQIVFASPHGSITSRSAVRGSSRARTRRAAAARGLGGEPVLGARRAPDRRRSTVAFATVTFDEQARRFRSRPSIASSRPHRRRATRRCRSRSVARRSSRSSDRRSVRRPPSGCSPRSSSSDDVRVVLAMGLPILTALLGLGTASASPGSGSHLIQIPDFATQLAAMIGLGVGHRLRAVHRHPVP